MRVIKVNKKLSVSQIVMNICEAGSWKIEDYLYVIKRFIENKKIENCFILVQVIFILMVLNVCETARGTCINIFLFLFLKDWQSFH